MTSDTGIESTKTRKRDQKEYVPDWALVIRARRIRLGYTQEDVQAKSGDILTQSNISDIERGKVQLENVGLVKALALTRALGWTLLELQKETGIDLGIEPDSHIPDSISPRNLQLIQIKKPTRGDLQLSPASRPTLWVDPEKKEGLLVYLINGEHWILNPENPLQSPVEALGAVVKIDFEL